jgi:hypothetical protein
VEKATGKIHRSVIDNFGFLVADKVPVAAVFGDKVLVVVCCHVFFIFSWGY